MPYLVSIHDVLRVYAKNLLSWVIEWLSSELSIKKKKKQIIIIIIIFLFPLDLWYNIIIIWVF